MNNINLSGLNVRDDNLQKAYEKRRLARDIRNSNLVNEYYLPLYIGETREDYLRRLNETYFFNKIDNIINNYVSKPFKRDFRIFEKNGNDEFAKNLNQNFDGQGHNVTDYLKLVLKEGMYYSQSHSFVDLITNEDNKKEHVVNLINCDDLLGADIDHKGKFTYLRFRTEEHKREGFLVKKYLVIKEYIKKDKKIFWNDYVSVGFDNLTYEIRTSSSLGFELRNSNIEFGINEIPFTSFYPVPITNSELLNPPIIFQNAFDLQLIHFKTASRLKNNETLYSTATKVLETINVDDNEERKVDYSAKSMWVINQGDKLYWDVPPHDLLDKFRNEMSSISAEIDEVMGNILYGKSNGSSTATENILNASNTNNFLSSVSNSLQWHAEKIIYYIKLLTNEISVDIETTIITDFSISLNQNEVTALFQLYSVGGISLEDLFDEFKRRNLFDDYLDFKETMLKKKKEESDLVGVTADSIKEDTEIEDLEQENESSLLTGSIKEVVNNIDNNLKV